MTMTTEVILDGSKEAEQGRAKMFCNNIKFHDPNPNSPDDLTGLWMRLMSWDESKLHNQFGALFGKKVRITIEVIE